VSVDRFWAVVEQGRAQAHNPSDAEEVAERTRQALTALPAAEVGKHSPTCLWCERPLKRRWTSSVKTCRLSSPPRTTL
jgi:hypothetical protein